MFRRCCIFPCSWVCSCIALSSWNFCSGVDEADFSGCSDMSSSAQLLPHHFFRQGRDINPTVLDDWPIIGPPCEERKFRVALMYIGLGFKVSNASEHRRRKHERPRLMLKCMKNVAVVAVLVDPTLVNPGEYCAARLFFESQNLRRKPSTKLSRRVLNLMWPLR